MALLFKKYPTQTIDNTLDMRKIRKINLFRKKSIELKTIRLSELIANAIPFQVKKVCTLDKSESLCKVSVFNLV